jgi:hypothetical protein
MEKTTPDVQAIRLHIRCCLHFLSALDSRQIDPVVDDHNER